MGLTQRRGERGDKMTSSAPPRLRVSQFQFLQVDFFAIKWYIFPG
jgi:hypothetical protein